MATVQTCLIMSSQFPAPLHGAGLVQSMSKMAVLVLLWQQMASAPIYFVFGQLERTLMMVLLAHPIW